MARTERDPDAPGVLEAVLERIRRMTREEWIDELAWHPQGVEETWRTQHLPVVEPPGTPATPPAETPRR